MANKDTVKPWFETGDYPTQAQFWQMFEWLRWKDEKLEVIDVNGLQDFINNMATIANIKARYIDQITLTQNGSYAIPAGAMVTGMIIDAALDFQLSIGSTDGGNDIADAIEITNGKPESLTLILYAKTDRTIYFSGINSSTKIIILKNSI